MRSASVRGPAVTDASVWRAPLGTPVVPDVKYTHRCSRGSRAGGGERREAGEVVGLGQRALAREHHRGRVGHHLGSERLPQRHVVEPAPRPGAHDDGGPHLVQHHRELTRPQDREQRHLHRPQPGQRRSEDDRFDPRRELPRHRHPGADAEGSEGRGGALGPDRQRAEGEGAPRLVEHAEQVGRRGGSVDHQVPDPLARAVVPAAGSHTALSTDRHPPRATSWRTATGPRGSVRR